MIDAAERIVAEQGFPALTLRAVQEAAGQSNKSAANYHFGSRDGLIAAILDERMAPVSAHRRDLLDAIAARFALPGAEPSPGAAPPSPPRQTGEPARADGPLLRALTDALVVPLARRVFGVPDSAYARFLAQSLVSPELAAIVAERATRFTVAETQRLMVRVLCAGALVPGLDADTARWRADCLVGHMIGALADAEPHSTPARGRLITARLTDTCFGLLTAPASAITDDPAPGAAPTATEE